MNKIPVIYYHSIAPKKNKAWYKSYLTLELIYLEDLLIYLTKKKYTFLFLDEYVALREDEGSKDKRLVCLNFDDGCLDNYVYAFPLLKKYKAKATIYINPEFVPENVEVRKTLDDVWTNKVTIDQLEELGFCSWEEMMIMEKSGLVDIQSHTLSHTKHFVSDKIREIHNPRSNYLYPVANLFPQKKPYYITDKSFKKLIPYGTPFFEERSSVIAKRVFINPEFEKKCVELLKNHDWEKFDKEKAFRTIDSTYKEFTSQNKIITGVESDENYKERVKNELLLSKQIIEKKLNKVVSYCCWPHGDYNEHAHRVAIDAGYKASTVVLKFGEENKSKDRFDRIGHGNVRNSRFLTLLKVKYKIKAYKGEFPFSVVERLYNNIKYGKS